jgi:hypothetical protein
MIRKNRTIKYSLFVVLVLLLSACAAGADTAVVGGDAQMPAMEGQAMPEGMQAPEGAPAGEMPAGEMPEGAPPQGQAPEGDMPVAEDAALEGAVVEQVIHTVDFDQSLPNSVGDLASDEAVELNINGVIVINNKTYVQSHEDLSAAEDDQSVAIITGGGSLTVADAQVVTSGDSSSLFNSRMYGQNSAFIAEEDSAMKVLDCTIKTSGSGANAVFATDELTTVMLADSAIEIGGDNAHAVLAVKKAAMDISNTDMSTGGDNAPAVAIGRLGGSITLEGGSITTSGSNSPAIQTTGAVSGGSLAVSASGAEAVAVEGAGSVALVDSDVSASLKGYRGITLFQSIESQDEALTGSFSMTGGSLAYTGQDGPLFYVTNTAGVINLGDVDISVASGVLLSANTAEDGSVNTSAVINADQQVLEGDLIGDNASRIELNLQNGSTLTGAIDTTNLAKATSLTLDADSTWTVTADSFITKLTVVEDTIEDGTVLNIIGNGHTVYYNANANTYLKGRIYSLSGGGFLKPLN